MEGDASSYDRGVTKGDREASRYERWIRMKFKLSSMTLRCKDDLLRVMPTYIDIICYLFGLDTTLKNRNTINYLSSLGTIFKEHVSVDMTLNLER